MAPRTRKKPETKPDEGTTEDVNEQRVSRGMFLQRLLASMEFVERAKSSPGLAEYTKDFDDERGRRARLSVVLNKGVAGMEGARLDGFILTVTMFIPPETDAVEKAPKFARSDMTKLLQAIGTGDAPVSLEVRTCAGCRRVTPDYIISAKGPLCPSCSAEGVR